jgi:hypothetical protein
MGARELSHQARPEKRGRTHRVLVVGGDARRQHEVAEALRRRGLAVATLAEVIGGARPATDAELRRALHIAVTRSRIIVCSESVGVMSGNVILTADLNSDSTDLTTLTVSLAKTMHVPMFTMGTDGVLTAYQ